MTELTPYSLKDEPTLIEKVYPAQKVSFEAQRERKAGSGQTLTALGSYWKGRKPLILVRSIILGCLLPPTGDNEKDLEIYEQLLGFDEVSLARRAMANNAFRPKDFLKTLTISDPWYYFDYTLKSNTLIADEVDRWQAPFNSDAYNIALRWKRKLSDIDKLDLYIKMLRTLPNFETRAALSKRLEELDQSELFEKVWIQVNNHYRHLGINANSHQELIEQLGILRFGHRPKLGDTFCGGGSIPFEAGRLGCDVYASDLNPIACMLTWGALNIIGSPSDKKTKIVQMQREVTTVVDAEITALGIEHDHNGNRAKAYLYCLEVRCPETGWMVPLAPSWVISKGRNVIAKLIPDYSSKCFKIEILTDVNEKEMKSAELGTVRDGKMVYVLEGKSYSTPIKTLRGDYRAKDGTTTNRLRRWEKSDFKPRENDIFQERLYCIQWIIKESLNQSRQSTFFAGVTPDDLKREKIVEDLVQTNLTEWQVNGFVPDMAIETGYNTAQPIRERGWTYWHHLFSARNLLIGSIIKKHINAYTSFNFADILNFNSKLCRWTTSGKRIAKDGSGKQVGGASDNATDVFSNQVLNTNYNYAFRSTIGLIDSFLPKYHHRGVIDSKTTIITCEASSVNQTCDIWITDPPYADAVQYHEITEFFISWLRKNSPSPFNDWTWDSRRALAIKGDGNDFRLGMINAYKAMTEHMPSNGMQCVMFTHQDANVWADMVGIFWSAGLQVVAAWYIATETTSELKKGGYVQGTVSLILRKRPSGENIGFKQRILPAVRKEVQSQIDQMMHLNKEIKDKEGEPVFNHSDLQMAGYAAALKILTAYTSIGGEDVTSFALRPRRSGETTIVDEIVQQAAEVANGILVPDGLNLNTWHAIDGIQRFYLRMIDMETTGASKLDNYQNFAKAFRVTDYTKVMANMTANSARLKGVIEFTSRELTDSTEIGPTSLGRLIIALQQLIAEIEPQAVIRQLQLDLVDFMELRPVLIDLVKFIARKSNEIPIQEASEVLAGRLHNMRLLSQD